MIDKAIDKASDKPVLVADKLAKTFRRPFSRRKVEAVQEVSFEVTSGETFGFLGPNGAGKTTTIKMLTGLIAPTSGSATILGDAVPSPNAMRRVGFLPENPYIYPYLTPREFVTMCGRLSGVRGKALFSRVASILARVGMAHAIDRPVRALSKGMLQRVGLASALVHEPELLILDEPMSGLDPVGRKEIRDLIVDERKKGRTVFFSTHILSDVEMICDRVCILREGRVVVAGKMRDLLGDSEAREITLEGASEELKKNLVEKGHEVRDVASAVVLEAVGDEAVRAVLENALASGAKIASVVPKRETLEEIFVRRAL
ncbi:MAG: ATP-binding cassette domain-containing protein [Polyangiaceae bacterium]